MAKYSSYTNNNHPDIVFENVSTRTVKVGLPIARSAYLFDENNKITFALPVINVIDIDWNHVHVSEETGYIDNTSDLIYIIKELINKYQSLYSTNNQIQLELSNSNNELQNQINSNTNAINSEAILLSNLETLVNELQNKEIDLSSYAEQQWVNNQIELAIANLPTEAGKSAYEIAVEHGFEGTVEEWLVSLHGDNESFDTTILNNYITKTEFNEYKNGVSLTTDSLIQADIYINQDIQELEQNIKGDVSEDYNTLEKLANAHQELQNKVNDDIEVLTNAVNTLANEQSAIDNQQEIDLSGYVTIEAYNELLARVTALEDLVHSYHSNDQEPNETPVFMVSTEIPTIENFDKFINTNADKPEEPQAINMTELSGPTLHHLIYPLDWEVVENDQLIKPVIKDENNFEIGAAYNSETPIIEYNNVQYRVLDIMFGKGNYTIEF